MIRFFQDTPHPLFSIPKKFNFCDEGFEWEMGLEEDDLAEGSEELKYHKSSRSYKGDFSFASKKKKKRRKEEGGARSKEKAIKGG